MARKELYSLPGYVSNFRLRNFATGAYKHDCPICKTDYYGDKRSGMCLGCAIKAVEEKILQCGEAPHQHAQAAVCPTCSGKVVVYEEICTKCGLTFDPGTCKRAADTTPKTT